MIERDVLIKGTERIGMLTGNYKGPVSCSSHKGGGDSAL